LKPVTIKALEEVLSIRQASVRLHLRAERQIERIYPGGTELSTLGNCKRLARYRKHSIEGSRPDVDIPAVAQALNGSAIVVAPISLTIRAGEASDESASSRGSASLREPARTVPSREAIIKSKRVAILVECENDAVRCTFRQ
jgi:hypothetical protein